MKKFQQIFLFSEMIKYILFLGGGFPVYNNPRPNPGCQVLTMRLQKIINTGCKTKIHPMSGNQLGSRWTWGPTWTSCFSRSNPVSCFPGPKTFLQVQNCFFQIKVKLLFLVFQKQFSRSHPPRLSPALAIPGHSSFFFSFFIGQTRSPFWTIRPTQEPSLGLAGAWSSNSLSQKR